MLGQNEATINSMTDCIDLCAADPRCQGIRYHQPIGICEGKHWGDTVRDQVGTCGQVETCTQRNLKRYAEKADAVDQWGMCKCGRMLLCLKPCTANRCEPIINFQLQVICKRAVNCTMFLVCTNSSVWTCYATATAHILHAA